MHKWWECVCRCLVYPMTQESTNCTTNSWSDQPSYSEPCTQTHRRQTLTYAEPCLLKKHTYQLQVSWVASVCYSRENHDQSIVVEEAIFAQLLWRHRYLNVRYCEITADMKHHSTRPVHLRVQFLLHIRPTSRCQHVVQHYEYVTLQVKGQVSTTQDTAMRYRLIPADGQSDNCSIRL